jgi:hypothetical protein
VVVYRMRHHMARHHLGRHSMVMAIHIHNIDTITHFHLIAIVVAIYFVVLRLHIMIAIDHNILHVVLHVVIHPATLSSKKRLKLVHEKILMI